MLRALTAARGDLSEGGERHLRLMVTRLLAEPQQGNYSHSITAMQRERLAPHEMKLESPPPKKSRTTQPQQQGRSTEKPTRIESIRNILTCPVMTHIGKLWQEHISRPRKGGGVTGSKWCFPEPSWSISWTCPQAATTAPTACQPRHATKGLLRARTLSPALLLLQRRAVTSTAPARPS